MRENVYELLGEVIVGFPKSFEDTAVAIARSNIGNEYVFRGIFEKSHRRQAEVVSQPSRHLLLARVALSGAVEYRKVDEDL